MEATLSDDKGSNADFKALNTKEPESKCFVKPTKAFKRCQDPFNCYTEWVKAGGRPRHGPSLAESTISTTKTTTLADDDQDDLGDDSR